jgi:hypothetical protein
MRLPSTGSVESVVLFPRNGLINRIQAMASTQLLGDALNAPVRTCWAPCDYLATPASEVFDTAFIDDHLVSADALESHGVRVDGIPLYVSRHGDVVGLRGHDRGEQALLQECLDLIAGAPAPARLVVVAGGSFHLVRDGHGEHDERERYLVAKRDYYRALPLHPAIEERARTMLTAHPEPFIALHLRYTDLAHKAPFPRDIERAVRELAERTGITHVFIASDSRPALQLWHSRMIAMGLVPWSLDSEGLTGSQAALADWRLLGSSHTLVHFAGSSFSTEAAVAAGTWSRSVALPAHPLREAAMRVREHGRHGWRRLTSVRRPTA